jgi:hypothetical protein
MPTPLGSPRLRPGLARRALPLIRGLRLSHPWLAAVAPILLLGAANMDQITATSLTAVLAVSLVGTSGLFAGLWLGCRDARKAALITTAAVGLFYGYGHLYGLLAEGVHYTHRAWLNAEATTASLALLLLLAWCVWRTQRSLEKVTQFALLLAISLTAAGSWQIAEEYRQFSRQARRRAEKAAPARTATPSAQAAPSAGRQVLCEHVPVPERIAPLEEDTPERPDIYYIILDGYGRADMLREVYRFDNSQFVEGLRQRGFYVADASRSNYPMTFLSLASSLNMRYLADDVVGIGNRRRPIYHLIQDHAVGHYLQAKGYRCLHIASNWGGTERSDVADVTFQPGWPCLQSEFVTVLLRTTLLHPLAPCVAHTHLFAFDKLEEIPRLPGPTFTFVHIVAPHNPYVFDRDGNICEDVTPAGQFHSEGKTGGWENLEGYIEQLRFINKRTMQAIDTIQRLSPHPPVIIVQADHGTATRWRSGTTAAKQLDFVRERMPILNAYCVPEACRRRLYPEISPVNSFRLLFDGLFGDHLEPLPDRQFFSWYSHPYQLRDVTRLFQPTAELARRP